MINYFFVLLDILVIINILYEMIKILHKKILNLIHLYQFHNDISEKNSSLNDHSNKPWINGYRFVISSVK